MVIGEETRTERKEKKYNYIYLFNYLCEGRIKGFFIELCEERDSKDEDGFVRRREKSF